MSMQAVGWLSSKFGLNIGGRSGGPDPLSESPQEGGEHSHGGDSSGMMFGESSSPFTSRPETGTGEGYFSKERAMEAKDKAMSMASDLGTKIAPLWGQVNNQARSLWDRGLRRTNNSASDPFATGPVSDGRTAFMTDDTAGYNTEVDENGLPVSKDWYYFDSTLNRWAVDPSAPPSVRAAFEQQLLEEEARQQSVGTGAPPPLPPPPPPSMGGGLTGGYGTHRLQGGPQYAVPNYFGSVSPVSQGAQQSSFPPPPVATTALTTTSTMIPPPQPAQPYAQSAFLTNTPPNPAPTQPSPAAQFVRPSASSIASAPMPARLHTTSAPSLYSPPAPTPGATIPLSTTYAAAPPPAGTGVVPSTQTYAAHAPAPASLYPPAHQRSASGPSSVPSPAGLFGPNLTSSSSSNQLGPMGGTYPSAPPAAAPSPAFTYAAPSQGYASSPSGLYPTAQTNNLPSAYPAYQPPTTMALTTPSHAAPPPPPPAFKPFQPS